MSGPSEEDALFAKFSMRSLERELATAVKDEETRVAVDEMKKKAIKTATSYDDFKNLVACAQQKPVERGSLVSFGEAKVVKNRVATVPTSSSSSVTTGLALSAPDASCVVLPRNLMEFSRDWTRHCKTPSQKFVYIARCGAKLLKRIFRDELDPTLLGEMLACFESVLATEGDVEGWTEPKTQIPGTIATLLSVFPTLDPFNLTIVMLTKEDMACCQRMLDTLAASVGSEGVVYPEGFDILTLRTAYRAS